MPYTAEHKANTRRKIVKTARILFNHHGFANVTIDQVMSSAGLTRGGFYNHFRNKEELYAEAVYSFLNGRGKAWRDDAGIDPESGGLDAILAMLNAYLSSEHAKDIDGQCPMIALPSDVARSTAKTRQSYEALLRAMIWLFENNLDEDSKDKQNTAMVLSSLCVGGMVLSRTIENSKFAEQLRRACKHFANEMLMQSKNL